MKRHALGAPTRFLKEFYHFIRSWIELCDGERLLQIGQCCGILARRLVVREAAPLSVHRDLRSVEAPMQAGRNETWRMAHGSLSRAGQQVKQLLLVGGLNGEDVDHGDKLATRRDRCSSGARACRTHGSSTVSWARMGLSVAFASDCLVPTEHTWMSAGTRGVPGGTRVSIPEIYQQRGWRLLVLDASSVRRSPRDEIHSSINCYRRRFMNNASELSGRD